VIRPARHLIALASTAVFTLTFVACADDGNDRVATAERAGRLAAELRASATTRPVSSIAAKDDSQAADSPAPTTMPVTPSVEPTGVVVPIIALDNSFRPDIVSIAVGDEVLWENRGLNDHDVLRVEGEGWGIEAEGFGPGAVYAHVFTDPGEYRYYCSIHGNQDIGMTGTIIVEG
jgi:plastocyanin